MSDDSLRYPIGPFEYSGPADDAQRRAHIDSIAAAPAALRAAVKGLTEAQLDTPYRDGGWTVRQVANHVPDSHMNGYIRCKLAVTESAPTIKPYHEDLWSQLPDARTGPIDNSLALLELLHERWTRFLRTLSGADWEKTYVHPEYGKTFTLDKVLALYSWHGRHHVGHITSLRQRNVW
jgi:uncharacterized damage-inducible protein DinB